MNSYWKEKRLGGEREKGQGMDRMADSREGRGGPRVGQWKSSNGVRMVHHEERVVGRIYQGGGYGLRRTR